MEKKQDITNECDVVPPDPNLTMRWEGNDMIDGRGRLLVRMCEDTGKVIYARYVDMHANMKESIAIFVATSTGKDKDEILSFLNFEDENDVFCS